MKAAGVYLFVARRSRLPVLLACVFMVAFGMFLAGFYGEVRPDRTLAAVVKFLPRAFRGFLGGEYLNLLSPAGFLAMNYKHPLSLLCMCAATITVASRVPAGEIGAGTIDLLLSHPVRRTSVVFAVAAVIALASVAAPGCLWLGHLVGTRVFAVPIEGYAGRFAPVVVQAALFSLFSGLLALLVSSASRTRGRAVGLSVTLIGIALFAELAAKIYEPLDWLRYVTPFGYFEPARAVLEGRLVLGHAAALLGGSAIMLGAAARIFAGRQL